MRFLGLSFLLLAACSPLAGQKPNAPTLPAVDAAGACNAATYGNFVGKQSEALEKILILGPVRVIRPGQAVTMDFMATRLNFTIDDTNRIARISCG